jgi:hypothetical protein
MAQSTMVNEGHTANLLRGAGTQMALWFYAIVHLLRLRQPLAATIHQQKFVDLNLNNSVRAAVHDIKDDKFWKCIYVLLRAVFPALRLLCYCNKSKPAMDKIFFSSHRTTLALKKSKEFLNNRNLFGSLRSDSNLTQKGTIVLGEEGDIDEEDVVFENAPPPSEEESNHDEESIDEDAPTQLSQVMPYNSIMSFGRAWSTSMPLQVGHCASWKMSKRMSKSN